MKKPTDSEILVQCREYVESMWRVKVAWDRMPEQRLDEFDPRRIAGENRLFAAEADLERHRLRLKKLLINWHTPRELAKLRAKTKRQSRRTQLRRKSKP